MLPKRDHRWAYQGKTVLQTYVVPRDSCLAR